jgi:hypothetical protein
VSAYDLVTDALRTVGMRMTDTSAGARSQCPAHGSRGYSLAVRPNPKTPAGPLQLTCFAGCETEEVLTSVGLTLRDLYDDTTARSWTPPRVRSKPNPFTELIPDPEHFCSRAVQQEALEAGLPVPQPEQQPVDPITALDAAWARHARAEMAEYGAGGGDGYGEWTPARKVAFADFRAEVDARHGGSR